MNPAEMQIDQEAASDGDSDHVLDLNGEGEVSPDASDYDEQSARESGDEEDDDDDDGTLHGALSDEESADADDSDDPDYNPDDEDVDTLHREVTELECELRSTRDLLRSTLAENRALRKLLAKHHISV